MAGKDGGSSSGGNKKKNESLVLPPRKHVITMVGERLAQSATAPFNNKNKKINPENGDDNDAASSS